MDQVLWESRTSPKEAKNTTSFRLTYGHYVALSVEIYLQSARIERRNKMPSEHHWNMMLDELVYLDEERLVVLDVLIRKKRE